MVAASFCAWQQLQTDKPPTWGAYLKRMGLSDEPKVTKADLQREGERAMANVERLIEKARSARARR